MPLSFLLDEHLRGPLAKAIQRQNLTGSMPIDVISVGDPMDLPLGSRDPDVLAWAAQHDRLVVSEDRATMRTHLNAHINFGQHSPGVMLLRPYSTIPDVVSFLVLVAHASNAAEWADGSHYIP